MPHPSQRKPVLFTDLDGTLLHPRTYSFEKAGPALKLVREQDVPLVLVSSKTRAELEVWRTRLDNHDPFVSENGGGIFVPRGYFPFPVGGSIRESYVVITLGMPYEEVRRRFVELRAELGAAVRGFGDMSVDEVRDLTGLPREDAELAMRRDFDEPFIFQGNTDYRFLQAVEGRGLRWTRGRIFHIMGDHHKGRAVTMLSRFYEQRFGEITTIGLGDNLNDLPFLLTVDRPVLVRKLSGLHDEKVRIPGLVQTEGVGPLGWNEAVLQLLGTTAPGHAAHEERVP